jgi:hypothetical protein
MNSLRKSLMVAGVVGTVGIGSLAAVGVANAESGTSSTDPTSSLVDKLALTFNLDKTKVQAVFDQQRTEMDAKREANQQQRLQALVDDKTITSAQKTAIEAKIAEMKAEHESNKDDFKSMTQDQRKAAMDAKKTALEAWAKEHGLDLTKLKGVLGGHTK